MEIINCHCLTITVYVFTQDIFKDKNQLES